MDSERQVDALQEMAESAAQQQPTYKSGRTRIVYRRPKVNGFARASMILGFGSLAICWIPIAGVAAIPATMLGLLLAFIGFVVSLMRVGAGFGECIVGLFLCGASLAVAILIGAGGLLLV